MSHSWSEEPVRSYLPPVSPLPLSHSDRAEERDMDLRTGDRYGPPDECPVVIFPGGRLLLDCRPAQIRGISHHSSHYVLSLTLITHFIASQNCHHSPALCNSQTVRLSTLSNCLGKDSEYFIDNSPNRSPEEMLFRNPLRTDPGV